MCKIVSLSLKILSRSVSKARNDRNGNITKEEFFEYVKHCIDVDRKKSFYKIRIKLNQIRKKTLKSINTCILKKEGLYQHEIFYQWYDFIGDTIDSKLYNPPYN